MKWYQPIPCDNTVDDPYVAAEGNLFGVEDWQLAEGFPIDRWDAGAWVKATSSDDDGDPDDVLQTYLGLPIYSSQLQRALSSGGVSGIQYLGIRVLRHDESEVDGFAIANVVNRVAALDYERSKYKLFSADWVVEERRGDVWFVQRPVLLGDRLESLHIVRLDEWPAGLFVSQVFKDCFDNGGFTGYSFSEVELS